MLFFILTAALARENLGLDGYGRGFAFGLSSKFNQPLVELPHYHGSTIVTAYFEISKSKHSTREYYTWMRNMLSLKDNMIIFTLPRLVESVRSLRAHAINKTKIIDMELNESMVVLKYSMRFWESQYDKDPERYHSPEMYIVWQEKSNFLKRAKDLNPFGTDFFAWVDVGYFRTTQYNNKAMIKYIPKKLKANQVFLLDATTLTGKKYLGGGFIGGFITGIEVWHRTY